MASKQKLHQLFDEMSVEVYKFIESSESNFAEGWVPATFVKDQLDLKKSSYPQGNKIDNKTGWLFATIARHLQDNYKLQYKKVGSRSFYKSCS